MKLLYVNSLYAPNMVGGAERFVQSLAEGVVKAGHQAIVICVAPQPGIHTDWVDGVKVYYLGLKNLYWPFGTQRPSTALKPAYHMLDTYHPWMARGVAHILDAEKPDLVHTNNLAGFSVLTWQAIKRRDLPLVHTLHDYYLLCPRANMFRKGKNCIAQCVKCRPYALPRKPPSIRVDVVVGVSRFILERHIKLGYFAGPSSKEVIFNGYQSVNGHQTESAILSSPTPSLPIRFGYLGRLIPDKGLEALLEAVAQLPKGTWSLDIAGRGHSTYEHYLRHKYRSSDIEFLGFVGQEAFFPEIDVLVVPSLWHDPCPRVFIEAYAHGVPVIGSNRGGIPELVDEERTGFLFDPARPGDLTEKMQRYIDQRTTIDDMRLACLEKATDFLPQNIVEQYREVYANLLDKA